ncbi:hypothetical protein ACWD7F_27615 [Streptomyces sp. NPDC005122]
MVKGLASMADQTERFICFDVPRDVAWQVKRLSDPGERVAALIAYFEEQLDPRQTEQKSAETVEGDARPAEVPARVGFDAETGQEAAARSVVTGVTTPYDAWEAFAGRDPGVAGAVLREARSLLEEAGVEWGAGTEHGVKVAYAGLMEVDLRRGSRAQAELLFNLVTVGERYPLRAGAPTGGTSAGGMSAGVVPGVSGWVWAPGHGVGVPVEAVSPGLEGAAAGVAGVGLRLVNVEGDGDCFYNAFIIAADLRDRTGTLQDAAWLREYLAGRLTNRLRDDRMWSAFGPWLGAEGGRPVPQGLRLGLIATIQDQGVWDNDYGDLVPYVITHAFPDIELEWLPYAEGVDPRAGWQGWSASGQGRRTVSLVRFNPGEGLQHWAAAVPADAPVLRETTTPGTRTWGQAGPSTMGSSAGRAVPPVGQTGRIEPAGSAVGGFVRESSLFGDDFEEDTSDVDMAEGDTAEQPGVSAAVASKHLTGASGVSRGPDTDHMMQVDDAMRVDPVFGDLSADGSFGDLVASGLSFDELFGPGGVFAGTTAAEPGHGDPGHGGLSLEELYASPVDGGMPVDTPLDGGRVMPVDSSAGTARSGGVAPVSDISRMGTPLERSQQDIGHAQSPGLPEDGLALPGGSNGVVLPVAPAAGQEHGPRPQPPVREHSVIDTDVQPEWREFWAAWSSHPWHGQPSTDQFGFARWGVGYLSAEQLTDLFTWLDQTGDTAGTLGQVRYSIQQRYRINLHPAETVRLHQRYHHRLEERRRKRLNAPALALPGNRVVPPRMQPEAGQEKAPHEPSTRPTRTEWIERYIKAIKQYYGDPEHPGRQGTLPRQSQWEPIPGSTQKVPLGKWLHDLATVGGRIPQQLHEVLNQAGLTVTGPHGNGFYKVLLPAADVGNLSAGAGDTSAAQALQTGPTGPRTGRLPGGAPRYTGQDSLQHLQTPGAGGSQEGPGRSRRDASQPAPRPMPKNRPPATDAMMVSSSLELPDGPTRKNIRENIRGLTQQVMADILDVTMKTLAKWEKGSEPAQNRRNRYLALLHLIATAPHDDQPWYLAAAADPWIQTAQTDLLQDRRLADLMMASSPLELPDGPTRKNIRENIRGLTQQAMADILNVPQPSIADWESDHDPAQDVRNRYLALLHLIAQAQGGYSSELWYISASADANVLHAQETLLRDDRVQALLGRTTATGSSSLFVGMARTDESMVNGLRAVLRDRIAGLAGDAVPGDVTSGDREARKQAIRQAVLEDQRVQFLNQRLAENGPASASERHSPAGEIFEQWWNETAQEHTGQDPRDRTAPSGTAPTPPHTPPAATSTGADLGRPLGFRERVALAKRAWQTRESDAVRELEDLLRDRSTGGPGSRSLVIVTAPDGSKTATWAVNYEGEVRWQDNTGMETLAPQTTAGEVVESINLNPRSQLIHAPQLLQAAGIEANTFCTLTPGMNLNPLME